MADQVPLFEESHDDIVERICRQEAARGQRITPWARVAIKSWLERGVQLPTHAATRELCVKYNVLPHPADCLGCGGVGVAFPPEDAEPRGYFLCPHCSFTKFATASAPQ